MEQELGVQMPPSQLCYCRWIHLVLFSFFTTSCYLLITMTFERFCSIIKPHKATSFNTVKRARIVIVCVLLFGFVYSFPYLFIAGNTGKLCIPNAIASENVFGELYYWFSEILLFVFPCISLLTMNSVIIHTLRKRSKQIVLKSEDQGQTEVQTVKTKHTEKQIFTMLLVVTFIFVVFNLISRSLTFYLNFYSANTPYYYAGLHLFYQIGEKSFYTNHGINFFLYVISGKKFRTDLKGLFSLNKNESHVSKIVVNSLSASYGGN